MSKVLTVTNVNVCFEQKTVLEDISFELQQGEILGLLGASGCGKTTLLNTIAGFIQQQAGEIHINQVGTVSTAHFIAPEKRHVGMIFQDYALFPHLTLEQNVLFGMKNMTSNEKQECLKTLLNTLELEGLNKQYPHELSGGQQQRVAIARALAPAPKLLLLDEPFSNIDARLRHDLIHELRNVLKALKMSAIFVTHNKDEVFAFADKVAIMHQGHIMQFGEPATVCQYPKSYHVADFLQLGSFIPVDQVSERNVKTPLGELMLRQDYEYDKVSSLVALVRAPYFSLDKNRVPNAKVKQVTVAEQGFKLRLNVEHEQNVFEVIAFSEESALVDDHVAVTLLPHYATLLSKH